jgi:hypothetical protein
MKKSLAAIAKNRRQGFEFLRREQRFMLGLRGNGAGWYVVFSHIVLSERSMWLAPFKR